MKQKEFSIGKVMHSFGFAFNGLKILFREEHNSWIHLLSSISIIIAGFYYKLSGNEWLAIVIVIGSVFMAEIINTAIENLSDFVSPEKSEQIKRIKDLSAAAVLMSAFAAIIVGLIVFLPKII
jgi:diacylglycerol kinase